MQHRLLNLQTSYIARLPDEVLLEIFERYYETTKHDVQYWEFHKRYDTFTLDPFCVIRLTHVCSRWRELAFRTPTLWNEVDMAWPDWMVPYISLAKHVPLELRNRIGVSNKKVVKCITSPDFSQQIRVIDLNFSYNDYSMSSLDRIPTSSLSQLRDFHLRLSDRRSQSEIGINMPSFVYHLPSSIHSLRMCGQYVFRDPLTLFSPALHTLELHLKHRTEFAQKIPIKDCIQALAKMHHLEELTLWDVFDDHHQDVTSEPRVMSHSVKKLNIKQRIDVCTVFLCQIEFLSLSSIF